MRLLSRLVLAAMMLIWGCSVISAQSPWNSFGAGGGGALFSLSMSPHNTSEIYMSTDMSSVFHSIDYGQSWNTVDFRRLKGGHSSPVRFTNNPQIHYAIHVSDDLDNGTPVRSADAGVTWNPLSGDPTSETYWLNTDPGSSTRLLLADYGELYFSKNSGVTFKSVYAAKNDGLRIAGTFWGADGIFVGTQEGLLVSTDNGVSFIMHSTTGLPSTAYIVGFAGAETGSSTRLLAITSEDVYPGITAPELLSGYEGVYRLDWGGAGWQKIVTGIGANDRVYFAGMANNDIGNMYLAGGNRDNGFPVIFKSNNGGNNWSSVFLTNNNANIATGWCGHQGDVDWWFPEYAMDFTVSPVDSNKAAITDFGFVHVTDDGGQRWRQAYVNPLDQNPANAPTPKGRAYRGAGLQQTSSWWINWSNANILNAAFTDIRGQRSVDGGISWQAGRSLGLPHNSTYQIISKPGTGTLYGATSTIHDIYQSTHLTDERIDGGEGHAVISNDNGASWQTLHDFAHPVIWLAFDPGDTQTLYASVVHSTQGGIYVTHDVQNGSAATWQKLPSPPRTQGHPFNTHVLNDKTLVATYSGHRDAGGTFLNRSGVFISTDGGTNWIDRSHAQMHWWTKDLVIDPHDPSQNTWLVSVFRHWGANSDGTGGLYRTTDRGQNWVRINDLARVESVTIDPQNKDIAYLTTETQGLWQTQNFTSANPAFTQDPDYPFQHPVRVFFNPHDQKQVWVTSFGGGMRAKMTIPTTPPTPVANCSGDIVSIPDNSIFPIGEKHCVASKSITSGKPGITPLGVRVPLGADIYFEAATHIQLFGGFRVNKGAKFHAINTGAVTPPPVESGHITYTLPSETVYRIAATKGAQPENISTKFDLLSAGSGDLELNLSPDGRWMVLNSDRGECQEWGCLMLANADATSLEPVKINNNLIHPSGMSAVSSGGVIIVYDQEGDPPGHLYDLWMSKRYRGDPWQAPINLTQTSQFASNVHPAISADSSKVVFECGDGSYDDKSVCEVNLEGTFRLVRVVMTDDKGAYYRMPDYEAGGVVFEVEASDGTEKTGRLPSGASTPTIIGNFDNDNGPCVLPDGRIVSLWGNNPSGSFDHEIKVMSPDGSDYFMLDVGSDVADIGLGCGE